MALTKITAKSVKDDAITTEQIAHATITGTNLANDSCTQDKIADEAVDEARLQISNAGTNGQFLSKQSGNTGGLTWATVESDKIEEGNTSVETVDTGSDGHVKITTEGNERTRFTSDGKILIGNITTPFSTTNYRKVQIGQVDGGWINLARTGVPADGNHLGAIQGFSKGADGTYHPVAGFDIKADGTPSNTSKPSRIEAYTTPASSTTQTERFRIGSAGQLGVAGANYGTSGQVLTSGGASAAPSWANPAAGGNSVDLVADGAIAAGKACIIKSNGKVAQVTESYSAMSTPTYDTENYTSANMPSAYCPVPVYSPTAGCYAFLYRSGDYSKIVAAKLSNGAWTVGSRLENVSGEGQYSQHASMCVVPASEISGVSHDVLAVVYRDYPGNNDGYLRLGQINSNNSVSLNSSYTDITGGDLFRSSMQAVGNGKILLAYSRGSSDGVKAMIINVTGSNSFSTGSEVSVGSSTNSNGVHVSEPDSNGKVIITYTNNSHNLKAVAASISGTTITLGTEVELDSYALSSLRECKVAYNKDDDNFLAVWSDNSLECAAMTVSGTTITKSAKTAVANIETRGIGVVYDSRLKHFWAHVSRDGNNNDTTNYYYPITETGATAPSIGTAKTTTFSSDLLDALNSFYYESDNIVVSVGRRTNNSNEIKLIAAKLGTTSSNFSADNINFIGFAEDAINDTATGTIKLRGNVVGNQSGLTPGLKYKVNDDSTLSQSWVTNSVGLLAIAADKGIICQNNGL